MSLISLQLSLNFVGKTSGASCLVLVGFVGRGRRILKIETGLAPGPNTNWIRDENTRYCTHNINKQSMLVVNARSAPRTTLK